jgi:hypothetical protein
MVIIPLHIAVLVIMMPLPQVASMMLKHREAQTTLSLSVPHLLIYGGGCALTLPSLSHSLPDQKPIDKGSI